MNNWNNYLNWGNTTPVSPQMGLTQGYVPPSIPPIMPLTPAMQDPTASMAAWNPMGPPQVRNFAAPISPFSPIDVDALTASTPFTSAPSNADISAQMAGAGLGTDPKSSGVLDWMKSSGLLGSTDKNGLRTDGWGGLALGGLSAASNMFMGMQQYKMAKETLANSKAQFERNFEAQKTTTNSALEDRQRARVASNSGAYESVGSYMDRNKVR